MASRRISLWSNVAKNNKLSNTSLHIDGDRALGSTKIIDVANR